jgi:hypothetical protein
MDWFRDNVGVGKALMQAHQHNLQRGDHYMNAFLQKAIQLLDTAAYANLTTDYCRDYFNPNTPNDPHVKYYSYGASEKFPSWSLFNLPCQLIKEKEGLNDGLVSVDSAKWGVYLKTLEADHWDLNGQR